MSLVWSYMLYAQPVVIYQVTSPPEAHDASQPSLNSGNDGSRLPEYVQHPSNTMYRRLATRLFLSIPRISRFINLHSLQPSKLTSFDAHSPYHRALKPKHVSPPPLYLEPATSSNDVGLPIVRTAHSGNQPLVATPEKTPSLPVANGRVTSSPHRLEKENVFLPARHEKATKRGGSRQKSSRGSSRSRQGKHQSLGEDSSQTAVAPVPFGGSRRKFNRGASHNREWKHEASGERTSSTTIASAAPLLNPTTVPTATPALAVTTLPPAPQAPATSTVSTPLSPTLPFSISATAVAGSYKPEKPSPLSPFVTVNSDSGFQTEETPFYDAPRSSSSSHLSPTQLRVRKKHGNEQKVSVVRRRMAQRSLPSSKVYAPGPDTATGTPSSTDSTRRKMFNSHLRYSSKVAIIDETDAPSVLASHGLMTEEQIHKLAQRLLAVHDNQLSMELLARLVQSVKFRLFRPEVIVQLVKVMDEMLPPKWKTLLQNKFGQFILDYCKACWDSEICPKVQRAYAASILGQIHGVEVMASVFIAEALAFLRGSSTLSFSQQDRVESIKAILDHCHPSLWSEYPDIDARQ
ncbi:hypothetical protein BDZ89DRAFT_1134548 [Hymenopellis radicata]|nr:hypothetical protein BDZ89DRAFT_1134548 [Hymenopellis radicata]